MTPPIEDVPEKIDGEHDTVTAAMVASLPLLALYPNLRQTGWAVFDARTHGGARVPLLATSGTAGPGLRTKVEPSERVSHQLRDLAFLVAQRRPRCIVCSWPGGMNWGAAGMRDLEQDLCQWARESGLPIASYPAPQVRAAIAGKPNASKDSLAYSVMSRLNMIGQHRSASEWEAIAVGFHHLRAN